MNAFNLALCIAPNMLWLPSPTGPEEESRSTKKVIFHGFGLTSVPLSLLFMGTAFCSLKEGIGPVTVLADGHPGLILSSVQLCPCWEGFSSSDCPG